VNKIKPIKTVWEVNAAFLNIWRLDMPAICIEFTKEDLYRPSEMAALIRATELNFGKTLILSNLPQNSLRLGWAAFPFNDKEYIFSTENIGSVRWTNAIPQNISNLLVEICLSLKIRVQNIQGIDTLEYRLTTHICEKEPSFCLFLQQGDGIRLIFAEDNLPTDTYFFSNDQAFRDLELQRIWEIAAPTSKKAFIVENNVGLSWLHDFLEQRSVNIETQNFKQAVIEKLLVRKSKN